MWLLSVALSLRLPSGALNFEATRRFFGKFVRSSNNYQVKVKLALEETMYSRLGADLSKTHITVRSETFILK